MLVDVGMGLGVSVGTGVRVGDGVSVGVGIWVGVSVGAGHARSVRIVRQRSAWAGVSVGAGAGVAVFIAGGGVCVGIRRKNAGVGVSVATAVDVAGVAGVEHTSAAMLSESATSNAGIKTVSLAVISKTYHVVSVYVRLRCEDCVTPSCGYCLKASMTVQGLVVLSCYHPHL